MCMWKGEQRHQHQNIFWNEWNLLQALFYSSIFKAIQCFFLLFWCFRFIVTHLIVFCFEINHCLKGKYLFNYFKNWWTPFSVSQCQISGWSYCLKIFVAPSRQIWSEGLYVIIKSFRSKQQAASDSEKFEMKYIWRKESEQKA